jgi:hypothetical protein
MQTKTLANDIKAYSEIIASHGAASQQAKQFRKRMAKDGEFIAFADSLDRLHENLNKQRAQRVAQPVVQGSRQAG